MPGTIEHQIKAQRGTQTSPNLTATVFSGSQGPGTGGGGGLQIAA